MRPGRLRLPLLALPALFLVAPPPPAASISGLLPLAPVSSDWVGPTSLAAQERPGPHDRHPAAGFLAKRDIPGELEEAGCSPALLDRAREALRRPASTEDRALARELAEEAGRAEILGDQDRARRLLERAVERDPGAGELTFRLARIEEARGNRNSAVNWLCRSLASDPGGPDAGAARALLGEVGPGVANPIGTGARAAFLGGVEALDEERYAEAMDAFSLALAERPGWASAHFNRALAALRAGQHREGVADLEAYLELDPTAPDRRQVTATLTWTPTPVDPGPVDAPVADDPRPADTPVAPPPEDDPIPISAPVSAHRVPSPATAFLSGVLIPGMGQIYTGRPGLGALILAGAGGAAAAGFLTREVEVRCLAVPVDGACPPGQEASRSTTRPLLVPALVGAGALTLLGAVHAARSARRSAAAQPDPLGALHLSPTGVAWELPRWDVGGRVLVRSTLQVGF